MQIVCRHHGCCAIGLLYVPICTNQHAILVSYGYEIHIFITSIIKYQQVKWYYSSVYPKKYAHGFVVLCFVVVIQSFIMNSHEVFIHIHQGCFAGTGAIVRLPQCQWSKPDGYGKISQCITTTKHSKANTVCIFLGIYSRYIVIRCGQKNSNDERKQTRSHEPIRQLMITMGSGFFSKGCDNISALISMEE